jgi:hypothetical protein
MKKLLYFLAIVLIIPSCKKSEGPGGTGVIKGKIDTKLYSGSVYTGVTIPGADVDVYIIYGGENTFYDDKITTSYDGSFEFRYLRKGDYKIFVYSKDVDNSSDGALEPVFATGTISKNNETIDVGTIEIDD